MGFWAWLFLILALTQWVRAAYWKVRATQSPTPEGTKKEEPGWRFYYRDGKKENNLFVPGAVSEAHALAHAFKHHGLRATHLLRTEKIGW